MLDVNSYEYGILKLIFKLRKCIRLYDNYGEKKNT